MFPDTVADLNRRFAVSGQVEFAEAPGGLMVAKVANAQAEATISLSGGHVMRWAPKGAAPVLWLSDFAKFAPGKSIRGGVPVCWPWFGPHATEAGFPAHGFARTAAWEVMGTEALPGGATHLALRLQFTEATRSQWPHVSELTIRITVGTELGIELVTRNLCGAPMSVGEALHTYFAVKDIRQCRIEGLEGCAYWDKAGGGVRSTQQGDIVIGSEVDRVYLDTESDCVVVDPNLGRRIRIAKSGSRSTVVWNPWIEKAEQLGDFGPEGYLGMVCVESANALENVVTVPAFGTHILAANYSVESLD